MSPPILNGVREAARKAQLDPDVRCVLLTAEGNNFCGGAAFGKGAGEVAQARIRRRRGARVRSVARRAARQVR